MNFKAINDQGTGTLWSRITSYVNTRLKAFGSVATEDVVPVSKGGHGATTAKEARTNLGITYGISAPTTAPATGDGTVYFFEDTFAPMAIEEGGTGAADVAGALDNFGIADYIIEQGTSDIWTYRKWNSGIMECWTTGLTTVTGVATTSLMGGYYTNANIKLPTGFKTGHSAQASARLGTGVGWALAQLNSATTMGLYVVGNQNSTSITFSANVKGTWK